VCFYESAGLSYKTISCVIIFEIKETGLHLNDEEVNFQAFIVFVVFYERTFVKRHKDSYGFTYSSGFLS